MNNEEQNDKKDIKNQNDPKKDKIPNPLKKPSQILLNYRTCTVCHSYLCSNARY